MFTNKDIPTNYYGIPSNKKHHKIIHKDLISRACKTCKAKENEECKFSYKNPDGVHMGRVPDGYDTVLFLIDYFNKHPDKYEI